MEKYKKYLQEGDDAIPETAAQRSKLQRRANSPTQVPQFAEVHDDLGDVEIREYDTDSTEYQDNIPFFEKQDESYHNWAEDLINFATDECENASDSYLRPKSLNDFIMNDNVWEPIQTTVDKSRGEIFLMALKFCTNNHLSVNAMTNLFKLINNIFETPVLPDSKYYYEKMVNSKLREYYHAVCNNCSAYMGKFEEAKLLKTCKVCQEDINLSKKSDNSYFMLLDPSTQISDLVHMHEKYYDYVVRQRQHEARHIEDVYDGKEYRKFVNSLPDREKYNYLTCVLNIDGALIFESSKYSIWPIFFKLNELPRQDRMNKLILGGLWFNKRKPDMTVFLDQFVNLINNITSCGIECMINDQKQILKLYVVNCCVDSPARAPIQGIKQFNGAYGCNWCLHSGEYHAGSMKYPYLTEAPKSRQHNEMATIMTNDTTNTPFGIKYPSPLLNLRSFNIVTGFIPDYLHACLEGVTVQFTRYFLEGKSNNDIAEIDHMMKYLAAPQQVQRLCRPISKQNDWNAREWENYVLYYSIPLFSSILT